MRILCALAMLLVAGTATAQQKIGHADWVYIFSLLPEVKNIQVELKSHEAQLQQQLQTKSKEFQDKYAAFTKLPENTIEAVRKDKEAELAMLQQNIQKFQQEANASLQEKERVLMEPVFAKVGKAIEAVAREQGYSYIFNPQVMGGGDILLFSDEKDNISNMVLRKLGVSPPAQTQSQKVE